MGGPPWRGKTERDALIDWVWPLLAAPFVGSMVGVLVRRLPAGRPVVVSRSACDSCGRALPPIELVPLLSCALQRGRCRACGAAIDPFHWQIEVAAILTALGVVVVAWSDPADMWADCALSWTLLALAWIDVEHGRLPDALTLPLLAGGLVVTWWLEPWRLLSCALGAAVGYIAFRLIALLYSAWRGREGLGQGDAKLLAAAGAWVGLDGLGDVVLLGAAAGIGMAMWSGRSTGISAVTSVPFGPGLAIGTIIVRLHG